MPRLCLFLLAALGVVGCQNRIPDDALALQPDTLERRLLESRRFAGGKEIEILSACSGVVQDMGFTIDESATPLGVMVALVFVGFPFVVRAIQPVLEDLHVEVEVLHACNVRVLLALRLAALTFCHGFESARVLVKFYKVLGGVL